MFDFSGKTALVTGASTDGMGRATAVQLASGGARVAVHYRSGEQGAKETLAAVEAAGGSGFLLRADFARPGAIDELWAAFDEQASSIDILVNFVGEPSK